jgi:hypothetical protein
MLLIYEGILTVPLYVIMVIFLSRVSEMKLE